MIEMTADFVVVGAGSAGAIVAARLSEARNVCVVLLEAGPSSRNMVLTIPAAARYTFKAKQFSWNDETEPERYLNGRRIAQTRGRVLGGSSSISGMVYLRGSPLDYEGWADAGAEGWNYADVLPYFQKLESFENSASEYQGRLGPVSVSAPTPVNPIAAAFLKACREAGYEGTDDVNGYRQEGFGRFPMNAAGGYRSSTARAYLDEAAKRPNLTVRTDSVADRIAFFGKRATSVVYRREGVACRAVARREVIVSAGPFNSPKLLLLSGIGPGEELRRHGIEVIHDLPGVGENLMDHQISAIQMACPQPVSLAKHLSPTRLGLFPRLHRRHQFVLHQPGRRFAHPEPSPEFRRRDPTLALADMLDRQKPDLERQLGAAEDRARCHRHLMLAAIALQTGTTNPGPTAIRTAPPGIVPRCHRFPETQPR